MHDAFEAGRPGGETQREKFLVFVVEQVVGGGHDAAHRVVDGAVEEPPVLGHPHRPVDGEKQNGEEVFLRVTQGAGRFGARGDIALGQELLQQVQMLLLDAAVFLNRGPQAPQEE